LSVVEKFMEFLLFIIHKCIVYLSINKNEFDHIITLIHIFCIPWKGANVVVEVLLDLLTPFVLAWAVVSIRILALPFIFNTRIIEPSLWTKVTFLLGDDDVRWCL
jgi:hypothetical protein